MNRRKISSPVLPALPAEFPNARGYEVDKRVKKGNRDFISVACWRTSAFNAETGRWTPVSELPFADLYVDRTADQPVPVGVKLSLESILPTIRITLTNQHTYKESLIVDPDDCTQFTVD